VPHASRLALVVLLVLLGRARSDEPTRFKDDYNKPASEMRPAPKGIKFVEQGKNDPRLKGCVTPEGIKVEIVAEAPAVVNPVALTFGDDGTPFVLEPIPGDKKNRSRVKTLSVPKPESPEKPFRLDKAAVILEGEQINGILLYDGWLYTAGGGGVWRYKQSKPGGAYDVKEQIAKGFTGPPRSQVSGMTVGNDGWLYLTAGDEDNHVVGSDGSKASVLHSGAVYRCRPDGSKMELFALGFHNPFGSPAQDSAFNLFLVDEEAPDAGKFAGCRLIHVAEGADFGWRRGPASGVPDLTRSAVFGELPGKQAPLLKTGKGEPSGLFIYNDTFFPESYRGLLYYPDAGRKLIRAYRVERLGAGFRVAEEFELMKSSDPLFRPCQMTAGPDGAIYVVDRRGDGKQGRVYRLTWAGTSDSPAIAPRGLDAWATILKQTDKELIKSLASENFTDRRHARQEVVRRGAKQTPALRELLLDTLAPSSARLTALGALTNFWDAELVKSLRGLLIDQDPDLRRLTITTLGAHGEAKGNEAVALLEDGDLDVRRAATLALGRTASPGTADLIVTALLSDDTGDPLIRDGYLRALERLGKTGIERLVSVFESGEAKKINQVAVIFLALRTREAAAVIPRLLAYPHLSPKQREVLVRSYRNYQTEPPIDMEPLAAYFLKRKDETAAVKLAGLEALALTDSLSGDEARKWVASLLEDGKLDRASLLQALGVSVPGVREAGRLMVEKKLPRELLPRVLALLKRHAGDKKCDELLAQLAKQ
jgi:putative membrane-bound dehydrogenase-like protein